MKYYPSVLTKQNYSQSPQNESEHVGCMPGLFRIFYFRKTPKLISHRSYNIKHPVVLDVNENPKINEDLQEIVENSDNKGANVQSVKILMEEEMSKLIPPTLIPSSEIENQISDEKEFEKNSILMTPPSPESINCTNPTENSDLESNFSNLSSRDLCFKLHERSSNSTIFDDNNNNNNNKISTNNGNYSRIVILKPRLSSITSPTKSNDFSERNFQHFSIREIKRRLKHTIIENKRERDSISLSSFDSTGKERRFSTGEERRVSTGEETTKSIGSFSYEEAKKHLIERVDSLEIKNNGFGIVNERKSLSKLISFPDIDLLSSPICSPKKEDFDDSDLFDDEDSIFKYLESHQGENNMKELDLIGEIKTEENNNFDESLDPLEEGSQNEEESLDLSEEEDEEEIYENYCENLEEKETSPVFGDLTKSPSRISKFEEIPIQRTIIKFKEIEISPFIDSKPNSTILNGKKNRFDFIRGVIEASGLINSQDWRKTVSTFLDPFLYDEIGVSCDYSEESKILFDLIEEALIEIKNKYSVNNKYVLVPFGEALILEVCKGVESYLVHQLACSLDWVVKKDLDNGSNWKGFVPDRDSMVIDLGDEIFDDLLEEIAFDLWL